VNFSVSEHVALKFEADFIITEHLSRKCITDFSVKCHEALSYVADSLFGQVADKICSNFYCNRGRSGKIYSLI